MKLRALGFGSARADVIDHLRKLPAFRKATRAMMLAHSAVEEALRAADLTNLIQAQPQKFGLLASSSFGELETTKDFLKHLADTGVARPLLFQNSLHNSTTGFLCIQYRLSASTVTLSHGCFAGEQALQAAELLLAQGYCEYLIVCTVDAFIPELIGSGGDKSSLQENAAAVVLSLDGRAKLEIEDVRTARDRERRGAPSYAQLASAQIDMIAQLAALASSASAAAGELRIEKPGFGHSTVRWARP